MPFIPPMLATRLEDPSKLADQRTKGSQRGATSGGTPADWMKLSGEKHLQNRGSVVDLAPKNPS